jgi:predicted pyridoxine 5'-phosphate oxidase superfamily flavin-nucleotide-binding protein
MGTRFAEIAFTPAVQAQQEVHGFRSSYERFTAGGRSNHQLGDRERDFIGARDGFYLGTVSETGWPYVQFRGGAPGFLRVLDDQTLAWADFRGNRQYVSTGNLTGSDRVSIFLMDYASQKRLKILGHAEIRPVESDTELAERLAVPGYEAVIERAVAVRIAGFDWNCPQHITRRYTADEIERHVKPMQDRIAELEAQLAGAHS